MAAVPASNPFLRASLDAIRASLAQGDAASARARCERLLIEHPDQLEVSNYLAMIQLRQGDVAGARGLLQTLRRVHPDDPLTLNSLAMLERQAGDHAAALVLFTELLQVQPDNFVARLHRGSLLERSGLAHDSLVAYARAMRDARAQGRWTSDETTAPSLREMVRHAASAVRQGTRRLFGDCLAPVLTRYGRSDLKRVQQALAMHLGELPLQYADERQRPTFLYIPGLPAQPYLPIEGFSGIAELGAQTDQILQELQRLLPRSEGRERVFESEQLAAENLSGAHGKPGWDGYYFYRHGERNVGNAEACPKTALALDALPLARTPGHAPEALFSVFSPGTHLLPHRGVTNSRVVGHLPLIVPEHCALSVAGEVHHWQVGKPVVFDDSYEHEAWNRSTQTRVVLIFDLWHPDLDEIERAAISDLVTAMADFREQTETA